MAFLVIVLIIIVLRSQLVCLIDIAPVEDNVIVTTEAYIRAILMKIVKCFDVELETRPLMERYLRVHAALARAALAAAGDWPELRRRATADVPASMADQLPPAPPHDPHLLVRIVHAFLQHVDTLHAEYGSELIVQAYMHTELMMRNSSDEMYGDEEQSYEEDDADASEVWSPKNNYISDTRRIYLGMSTSITSYPFVAAVLMFGVFQCAGAILSSDLVVTAASGLQLAYNNRLFRENPRFVEVRVGSSFHAVRGEVIGVYEVYFHPSYNSRTLNHNICLLRLERHIKFRGPRRRQVKKIEFDKREAQMPLNMGNVTMIGWGAKLSGNKVRHEAMLLFTRLAVYPQKDCQDVYSSEYVTSKNFCAGYVSVGGGACNRDVGDPAIVDGVLYGIVSFGAPVCGAPDSPTVFTKLGYYADWIETIMEQKVPSKRARTTTTTTFVPSIEYITSTMSTTDPNEIDYNDLVRASPTTITGKDILRINKEPFYSGRTVIADNKHAKKHQKETKIPSSDSYEHRTTKKHHRHHHSHRHKIKSGKKHIKDKNIKKSENKKGKKITTEQYFTEPSSNIYKEPHDLQFIDAIKTTIPSNLFDPGSSEAQIHNKKQKRKHKKQDKINLVDPLKPELKQIKTSKLNTRKTTITVTITKNIKNNNPTAKVKNKIHQKPPLISKYKLRDLLRPIPEKVQMYDLIDSDKIKLTNKMKKEEIHSPKLLELNKSPLHITTGTVSTTAKKYETNKSHVHKDKSDKTEAAKKKFPIGGLMEQTYQVDHSPKHKVKEEDIFVNSKSPDDYDGKTINSLESLEQLDYKITPSYNKYAMTPNQQHHQPVSSESDYYYQESGKGEDINKHKLKGNSQNINHSKHIYSDTENYAEKKYLKIKQNITESDHYHYNNEIFKPDYTEYGSMEEKYGGVKPNQQFDYHQSIDKYLKNEGNNKVKKTDLKPPYYYDDTREQNNEHVHSNLTFFSDNGSLDLEDIEYIEQKTLEMKRRNNNTLTRNFPNDNDNQKNEIKLPEEIEGLGSRELKQILTQLINRAKAKDKRPQNNKYQSFKSKNRPSNGLTLDDKKSSNDGSFYEKLKSSIN